MVNAQTIDDARMHQFKDKPVGVVKHRRVFNPDANQAGNFKKAPPGELLGASRRTSAASFAPRAAPEWRRDPEMLVVAHLSTGFEDSGAGTVIVDERRLPGFRIAF